MQPEHKEKSGFEAFQQKLEQAAHERLSAPVVTPYLLLDVLLQEPEVQQELGAKADALKKHMARLVVAESEGRLEGGRLGVHRGDPLFAQFIDDAREDIAEMGKLRRRTMKDASDVPQVTYADGTFQLVSAYAAAAEMEGKEFSPAELFREAMKDYGKGLGRPVVEKILPGEMSHAQVVRKREKAGAGQFDITSD